MAFQVPDFLRDLVAEGQGLAARAIEGITGIARPPHISIKNNRFWTVDAAGNAAKILDDAIEVVVVDANPHPSKMYFGRDYDPTDTNPPLCFSDNGLAPSVDAMKPQHPRCDTCKWNEWGSATSKMTGEGIRACADARKLAVLYQGKLYQLRIPPASLRAWKTYAGFFANKPISINVIETNLSFSDDQVGMLQFDAKGFIDQDTADMVRKMKKSDFLPLTGEDDKPRQAALPAPEPTGAQRIAEAVAEKVLERPKPVAVSPPPPSNKPSFMAAVNDDGDELTKAAQAAAQEEAFMGGAAPAKAARKKAPPKAQSFGMQEADTVNTSDQSLMDSIAAAMED